VSFSSNLVRMTNIVGIFDNARNQDNAVDRLVGAGSEGTVYDEVIVEGEAGKDGGSLVFGSGYAAAMLCGSVESESRPKRKARAQRQTAERSWENR
jgi:hypothetical protein